MSTYSIHSFGGNGGDLFDMQIIKTISMSSADYVDQLVINGNIYGGNGGNPQTGITLATGEYVNRIDLRYGRYLDYLKLTTNFGQTLEGGGTGGEPTTILGQLVALTGNSGNYIDRLNFLMVDN